MISRFLNTEQNLHLQEFAHFSDENVAPYADEWDRNEAVSGSIIIRLSEKGWLGAMASKDSGGLGFDAITFGLLNMAIGAGSASLTGLLNVHTMVLKTIEKWGSTEQRQQFLEPLISGRMIGAFAQTEVGAGGDTGRLATTISDAGDGVLSINGQKIWITYGQRADLFLLFGKYNDMDTAVLIPRATPGLRVTPKANMLGFKSAHLAVLDFENAKITRNQIVGKPGFGQSIVSANALDYGRISVAWAALGIQQESLRRSVVRANNRCVFGKTLSDQGIVAGYLAEMSAALLASQLICLSATRAKENREDDAVEQILQAKQFASHEAGNSTAKAVQIHGGYGCDESSGISRLYRDAKILQVVEGSNELLKVLVAREVCRRFSNET